MIFGFYYKNDKKEEIISRTISSSRLNAAKYFAARKQLELKPFLKVFGVKTII
jgi:hypothetical protein